MHTYKIMTTTNVTCSGYDACVNNTVNELFFFIATVILFTYFLKTKNDTIGTFRFDWAIFHFRTLIIINYNSWYTMTCVYSKSARSRCAKRHVPDTHRKPHCRRYVKTCWVVTLFDQKRPLLTYRKTVNISDHEALIIASSRAQRETPVCIPLFTCSKTQKEYYNIPNTYSKCPAEIYSARFNPI